MFSVLVSDTRARAEVAVDDDRIRKVVLNHAKNCVTTIADHAFWATFLIMSIFVGYSCGGEKLLHDG